MLKYKRILLKLSGEALAGDKEFGFSDEVLESFARQIKDFLTPNAITDLNFLGGIMICGLGINIVLKKNIKVANMLPSIFIPIIVEIFVNFFSHLF